jgi:hypothetical protein
VWHTCIPLTWRGVRIDKENDLEGLGIEMPNDCTDLFLRLGRFLVRTTPSLPSWVYGGRILTLASAQGMCVQVCNDVAFPVFKSGLKTARTRLGAFPTVGLVVPLSTTKSTMQQDEYAESDPIREAAFAALKRCMNPMNSYTVCSKARQICRLTTVAGGAHDNSCVPKSDTQSQARSHHSEGTCDLNVVQPSVLTLCYDQFGQSGDDARSVDCITFQLVISTTSTDYSNKLSNDANRGW